MPTALGFVPEKGKELNSTKSETKKLKNASAEYSPE